jgi:uncharacterized protein
MELAALSDKYGDFYAPAFSVRLAGADVVRDLLVAVSQVEAELVLNAASHFSFTLSNCYNLMTGQFETGRGKPLLELLTLGTEVEVCIGYGDSATTPTTMLGQVTEISTSFPETGAPELVVSGYDHGFPMTLGKNSDSWKERKDSEVAQLIAGGFHQLATAIDDSGEKFPQIEQNQESDWEFLKRLAKRNSNADKNVHFELYVDTGGVAKKPTLHFGKPRLDAAPIAKLKWGAGLLSFKPEANLAGQVSKVEVYGWDIKRKEPIVGRASANDAGPQGRTIAQHVGSLVRAPDRQPTLRLRQPVFTQAEADKRAKAALGDLTKKFLTGDAESVGLPELRPDCTVELVGLGDAFSKIYYIERASHRLDSSGYRTRFKVREAKR